MNDGVRQIRIGMYAVVFGIIYWPLEALIHVLIFGESNFVDLLIYPGANEAWMRVMISVSFVAFGIYAHRAIQNQQELNNELRHQQSKIRKVIDSAHDAYICINSSSLITDWNPMAEKMFGWNRHEVIGISLLDTIVPERFHKAHIHGMQSYLNSGSGPWLYRSIKTVARNKLGEEVSVEMAIIPIRSGNDQDFYTFIRLAEGTQPALGNIEEGTMFKQNDRRAHPRYLVSHRIQVRPMDNQAQSRTVRLYDISDGGISFLAEDVSDLHVGQQIEIGAPHPEARTGDIVLFEKGKIVWIQEDRDSSPAGMVGIQFDELIESRNYLD